MIRTCIQMNRDQSFSTCIVADGGTLRVVQCGITCSGHHHTISCTLEQRLQPCCNIKCNVFFLQPLICGSRIASAMSSINTDDVTCCVGWLREQQKSKAEKA